MAISPLEALAKQTVARGTALAREVAAAETWIDARLKEPWRSYPGWVVIPDQYWQPDVVAEIMRRYQALGWRVRKPTWLHSVFILAPDPHSLHFSPRADCASEMAPAENET